MNTHKHQTPARLPIEVFLCCLLVVGRLVYLALTLGVEAGYDTGAHLEMVMNVSWTHFSGPIWQFFYSYHPPLGFLFAHTITLLGVSPLVAVQLLNAIASLTVFFLIRATLNTCGLLDRPAAVFFLYLWSCLPIQLFLTSSINLDVLIQAFAAATLYCSVRLFWGQDLHREERLWLAFGIVACIAGGLLTKFSGLLLTAIPPLVAFSLQKNVIRLTAQAIAVALVGLALASPYYYTRYYAETGRMFPTNLEMFGGPDIERGRLVRDADRTKFFIGMLEPSPFHGSADEVVRDRDNIRLSDAWQDVWLKEKNLGPMKPGARELGTLEKNLAGFLLIGGLFWLLWRFRADDPWHRLGAIWLGFAGLQLLAFVLYLYSQPVAGWAPTKGIYLACSLPIVAYGIARLVPEAGEGRWRELIQTSVLTLVALLIILHHLLPIQ